LDLGGGVKIRKIISELQAAKGATTDVGSVDPKTHAIYALYLNSCERVLGKTLTADQMSECSAAITSKAVAPPKVLVKAFEAMLSEGGSPSASTTKGLLIATVNTIMGAMVAGEADPLTLAEQTIDGDASALAKASSLIGITLKQGDFVNMMQATVTMSDQYKDGEVYSAANKVGDQAWNAMAALWKDQEPGKQAAKMKKNPDLMKNLLKQSATQYANGDTTAFDSMKNTPDYFADLAEKCGDISGITDFEGMWKLADKMAEHVQTNQITDGEMKEKFAQGVCTQSKAADSESEWTAIKNNPGTFTSMIGKNPDAYAGSEAATIANDLLVFGYQYASLGGTVGSLYTPCSSNAQCASLGSGAKCGGASICVAGTVAGNSQGYGQACTAHSQCVTGYCDTTAGSCAFKSGSDPYTFTPPTFNQDGTIIGGTGAGVVGATCTANTDCFSQKCSSGVCAATTDQQQQQPQPPSFSFAGSWSLGGAPNYTGAPTVPFPNSFTASGSSPFSVNPGTSLIITYTSGTTCAATNSLGACTACTVNPTGTPASIAMTCPAGVGGVMGTATYNKQ
ncbi:MAG: hypothetical protein HY543_12090, partial [Deltaproteobacteria bacterium]|nr:hypothetical protein [Deltaproteobacteria bacterium]